MEWIYLSPHLDDVVLSCGGLLVEQARAGLSVQVWTICAGDPPEGSLSQFAQSLHKRWQLDEDATKYRRAEDRDACERLGASVYHFLIPDSIYRRSAVDGRHFYPSEESIFGEVHPEEAALVDQIGQKLAAKLPAKGNLVCPLSIGGHVDHRLTRLAVEALNRPLWYYPDFPYVVGEFSAEAGQIPSLFNTDWEIRLFPFHQNRLSDWQDAIAHYASQISTFWGSVAEMKRAVEDYYHQFGGIRLTRPKYF